jgi:hypothetical protein
MCKTSLEDILRLEETRKIPTVEPEIIWIEDGLEGGGLIQPPKGGKSIVLPVYSFQVPSYDTTS